MHDPDVVLFDIRRPFPHRLKALKNSRLFWPSVVTVWHREPGGRDSGTVCTMDWSSGLSRVKFVFALRHWRHLRIQVRPYDRVKGWMLYRCDDCGRRFRWRESRTGYMSGGTYHNVCMSLHQSLGWAKDLENYIKGEVDSNAKFRVEYRLLIGRYNVVTEAESTLGDTP